MTRMRILIGLVAFALPITQMEPAQAQKGPLNPKKNIDNLPNIKNIGDANNPPNIKNIGNPNNPPNIKNVGGGINNLKNNPNALPNLKGGNLNNALPNVKNANALNNLKNSGVLSNLKSTNTLNTIQKGNLKGVVNNLGVKNTIPISNRTGANTTTTNITNTKNFNGPINISNRFPKGGPIAGPVVVNNFNNNRRWPAFGAGLGIGLAIPIASRMIAPPVVYSVVEYPVAAPVFFGAPAFLVPEQPIEPEGVVTNPQPPDASGPQMTEAGLKILEVIEGGIAKKADLRPGDIIVGIGEYRVQTFEELQLALANAQGDVDVIFLNGESGKVERLPVRPDKGKIGVSVEPVDLN